MNQMNPGMYQQQPYPVYGIVQPSPAYRPLESRDVRLLVRQQPKEALVAVEGKEKGRKPVDPPPFVQLVVHQQADPSSVYLSNPYLFCVASLYDKTGRVPANSGKALTGTLVSSLHRVKDTDNNDGGFFVFGDVSVKLPGEHVLCFTLYDYRKEEGAAFKLCQGFSEPFKVVTQKEFRGLDESTYLSRAFSDQGIRLRLRKEPRAFGRPTKRGFKDTVEAPEQGEAEHSFVTDFNADPLDPERTPKRARTMGSDQYDFAGGMPRDWALPDPRDSQGQVFNSMTSLAEPFPRQEPYARPEFARQGQGYPDISGVGGLDLYQSDVFYPGQ
ncbi:hypothetical protein P152DRAFT_473950 [Eremomyces bilateralis CBS 781.70]|uniref:Velvet domain-containing protein n=1 Tax=Eremomyces bilateralis CBS 781.70 TaxID=1392243 RepID=A0A6G1G354_9PEZI|nr:uncharacterized protein P152DRAFT_473950 [Eremomyces bilateralis CBS 781.70]KAF1812239.1 hypothetical protein P152DRAFT_473950 [Eremomyces bilateralis CBS 781.70]